MSEPVVYVDTSDVRPGKLEELEVAVTELAKVLDAKEPQLVAYQVYFDHAGTRMTVLHVHRDAASLRRHMEVGGPLFGKFASLLELRSIDVYGDVPADVTAQLATKAEMLGGVVRAHRRRAGFARLPAS